MRSWAQHWVFSPAILACAAAHGEAPVRIDTGAASSDRFTILLDDPQARVVDALCIQFLHSTRVP